MVPGLWFDLDLAYGQHAASTLPATDAEALDFLATLPAEPSLIVHSGGGLYGYWLFKEPYLYHQVRRTMRGIRHLAAQFTHTLVTADRSGAGPSMPSATSPGCCGPPGTINHKYGKPVEVLHARRAVQPGDFDWFLDLPQPATHDARRDGDCLDSLTWSLLPSTTARPSSANPGPNSPAPILSMAVAPATISTSTSTKASGIAGGMGPAVMPWP